MRLSNSYASLGEFFYKESNPAHFKSPKLVLWNRDLAGELLISDKLQADSRTLAAYFSGQRLIDGSKPIATAYAGHQFGHFVPQLGDGRAHLLGDITDKQGKQWDIQLKGSGQTPFSRGGDGCCALGPAVREFIMSEAMYALRVPTTRSLAVVSTGENVFRKDMFPGAVVTRVASSHIRVGTFQYFAARDDIESLQKLCDYTIKHHYPEIQDAGDNKAPRLLAKVIEKQVQLITEWMRVGFIHGVMNTDNTALSGETIDYGPCAMMGSYHPDTVFSSIDKMGRYAFGNQANIIQWNMARLAECLLPLVHADKKKTIEILMPILESFPEQFEQAYMAMMGRKIGLMTVNDENANLIHALLNTMQEKKMDYTITFDALTKAIDSDMQQTPLQEQLGDVFIHWKQRLDEQGESLHDIFNIMRQHNPVVIPRNHHMEAVIASCEQTGEMRAAEEFLHVLRSPYEELEQTHRYQDEVSDGDVGYQTFCGT